MSARWPVQNSGSVKRHRNFVIVDRERFETKGAVREKVGDSRRLKAEDRRRERYQDIGKSEYQDIRGSGNQVMLDGRCSWLGAFWVLCSLKSGKIAKNWAKSDFS